MKIRLGFVSNSSTAGYVVSLEEFDNVIELAGYYVLKIIEHAKGNIDYKRADYYESLYNNILRVSKSKIDQNTPVFIPTYNFDTYIVKREDAYYIDTDHEFYFNIKGPYVDGLDEGDYGKYTKSDYYYLPEFDILGKQKCGSNKVKCKDCSHGITVVLKNGDSVCPFCNIEDLQQIKISPELSQEELNTIDELWREKFRSESEYFNWNRLREKMRDLGVDMAAREAVGFLSLYLEAIVKQVTKKCLELSSGDKITSDIMDNALEWIKTIKIKY